MFRVKIDKRLLLEIRVSFKLVDLVCGQDGNVQRAIKQ
jgi:hypothetical protein